MGTSVINSPSSPLSLSNLLNKIGKSSDKIVQIDFVSNRENITLLFFQNKRLKSYQILIIYYKFQYS